uniref:EF-hand domain-containing protein n=1 Tax=Neogobius melanostomus TaxID=47308 RepID=A0A8C6S991_9GOBI
KSGQRAIKTGQKSNSNTIEKVTKTQSMGDRKSYIKNVKDPAKLDELMKELDEDGDGQVDFLEFVRWVATMACVCNDFLESILADQ